MKFLNFILLIALVALIVFAALNWQAIITPIPLSLLFTDAEAPLGLILLSATGLLTLLFLSFVIYMQSTALMTRKRLNREVEEQRKLANDAEASRFNELRTYLENELEKLVTQSSEIHQKVESRLTEIETGLKSSFEESSTSLSAYIGELGDRLDKK
ncbi:MAG: LapA family protein [Methylophilaceae bacterium]